MILVEQSVYAPLREHLLLSGAERLTLSFSEVEHILGRPLPASARKRSAWWSNSELGHVQAAAWLQSSYRTVDLDLEAERIGFERYYPYGAGLMDAKQALYSAAGMEPPKEATPVAGKRLHPAFGSLRGTSIVLPGYDLTSPTSLLMDGDDGR